MVLPINQDSRHRRYQNEHQHQHHGAEDEVVWRQQCVSFWHDGCQGVLERKVEVSRAASAFMRSSNLSLEMRKLAKEEAAKMRIGTIACSAKQILHSKHA